MCVSLTNDSSETIEVIIKLDTVTASDMLMHHVFIVLALTFLIKVYITIASLVTLTFIQGHKCISSLTTFFTGKISDNI